MTIKGIKASFVAGINENGKTVVSARSLGDINVQVIMEKFGGGGHLNTAGTQTDKSPEEILELIREEMGIN
jgi:c-di-AMP phosphodiesterase-like protein